MAFDWNESAVYNLKTHWKDGLSASLIAKQLAPDGGLSRNAVIGKLHREGLAGRSKATRTYNRPAPKPRKENKIRLGRTGVWPRHEAPEVKVNRPVRDPGLEALSARGEAAVLSLDTQQCKYPIGDPKHADFAFCARTCSGVYCGDHRGLVYTAKREALGRHVPR
jgi:GcrA cell cycle regulator